MKRKEFDEIVKNYAYEGKFEISWTIGGRTGASCWDTGDPVFYGVDAEPEPEFEDLDAVLLEIAPNMSFLLYKKLMSKVNVSEDGNSDCYGNSTKVAKKTLTEDDLWDFLVEHNLV